MSSELNYLPELPTNRSVGIGCIGAGFIMADCHLVAYRQAGFNPVAITSRSRTASQQVADRHKIGKVYDSYAELLADPAVEVVDIAVPPDVQLSVIRGSVAAQKYPRHSGAKAAGDELRRSPRDRACARSRHRAGRQSEHALRPVGAGLQESARPGLARQAGARHHRHAGHSALDAVAGTSWAGSRCGS